MSQAGSVRGGPTRRSARLSSVARSVGTPSVAHTADPTSATPARRKPLAQVKSRQSAAYGSSGRLGIAEELSVSNTGFTQAFSSGREVAVERNDDHLMSGALNGDSVQYSPAPSSDAGGSVQERGSDYMSSDNEPEESEEIEDSGANTSKSFGMMREAGMLRARTPPGHPSRSGRPQQNQAGPSFVPPVQQTAHRPDLLAPPQTNSFGRIQQNVPLSVHGSGQRIPPLANAGLPPNRPRSPVWRPTPRTPSKLSYCYNITLGGLIALFAILLVLLTAPSGGLYWSIHSMRKYIGRPLPSVFDGILEKVPPGVYGEIQGGIWKSLVESREAWLEAKVDIKDMKGTINTIKDQFPPIYFATKDENGQWQIGNEFWEALISKLRNESMSEAWDKFIDQNNDKVFRFWEEGFRNYRDKHRLISQEDFVEAMSSKWDELSNNVNKKINDLTRAANKEVKAVAAREAKKVSVEHIRLHSLALANLVSNLELTLKKVNYFSPGLGAAVDTSLTSSSYVDNPAWLARTYRRVTFTPRRRTPIAALEPWEEPGECWCSAPDASKEGHSQLAVRLPRPMFPEQITIEHLPMTMAPRRDVSNAPQDIELWVESSEPPVRHLSADNERCKPGPAGWTCLGSVRYDIRGGNNVQTFQLDADSQIAVDHVIVRVTKNWGADHTCLYRVRLHGSDDGPDQEYEA